MVAQYKRRLTVDYMALPTSELIGRQRELTLIWNQYEVARRGYTRIVLLIGEQGIGKTRLLDQFAVHAVQDGATTLRGGAVESEGMPPYLPFLEALGQHIRVTPLDQLREQVAPAPQILASILPELAVRLGELPAAYALPSEQMRLRLYEAVASFLEVISMRQALVLTLDDLHWADTASLDLLCYLARHQTKAKLLIVGTYREGEIDRNLALERAVTELARQRVLTTIAVDPLSAKEIEALAVSYLRGSIDPSVSLLLHAQSEGNPFFAEEIIRGWVEEGALAQENEQWVAVAPLEHALPQSIVGALRQRFTRLSPGIIDHLRVAAIIGRTFNLSLLARVQGQEVEVVEETLLEAARARLIWSDQADVFTFSHDKIRECLYAEVSTSRRRRLHEVIGKMLEVQYHQEGTKSTYLLAELAFHFARSNDRVRGAIYSLRAAEQALWSSAFEEAMGYYHLALEFLDQDDERRGNVLLALGEAALRAGKESEAAVAYEEALAWSSRSNELEVTARVAHGLGLVQWRQEALQAARASFEQALELLGNNVSAELVRVLVDLATLLTIHMGQEVEGTTYARQALEMACRLGDKSLESAARRALAGKFYVYGKDLSSASQSLEQALALAEASDDPSEAAVCCFYLANAYYWMAEIRRSYEVSLRRIEFIERGRQSYKLRNAHSYCALLLASQGAWAEAEQAIERVQALVDHLSNPVPLASLHQIRGFLAYQREDYVVAEREFQAALVHQQRGPGGLMFFTSLLGLAQAALGKREEAYAYMAELEGLLAELPTGTLPTTPIITCLALTALTLGDKERAANLYPILLAFRGQHYWFLVDRVLGEIATLCGDWKMAAVHLSEAEATAQREGLRPELARVILGQAELEIACGGQGSITRATNLLNRVIAIFKELNMTEAVGRIRSRLRTLSHQPYSPAPHSLPANLTRSEAKVLQLVVDGKSNRQIAQELGISEKTVANHLSNIFNKTTSENRAAAAAFAIRHGLA